ncbi:MAG: FAD-dependent monooxygenase, partial [Acidobacteria bacterium]|nr:FAD-dependent monooxygenase [Acidobacteriota bacterium]
MSFRTSHARCRSRRRCATAWVSARRTARSCSAGPTNVLDVLIAGAGPAGAIAARQLALSGARVLMVDRETFPRDKLCGDTLNPGAIALLDAIGLRGGALDGAQTLSGMRVTGPGASVVARYPEGRTGVSITRRALDLWLLEQAVVAGARFESGMTVQGALTFEDGGETSVRGLVLRNAAGVTIRMPASVTIGADGRRSATARSVGLGSHPAKPRRWAYGAYFAGGRPWASGPGRPGEIFGEMHVRPGWYCGVAPMADGLMNVCVVTDRREGADDPLGLIRAHLSRHAE